MAPVTRNHFPVGTVYRWCWLQVCSVACTWKVYPHTVEGERNLQHRRGTDPAHRTARCTCTCRHRHKKCRRARGTMRTGPTLGHIGNTGPVASGQGRPSIPYHRLVQRLGSTSWLLYHTQYSTEVRGHCRSGIPDRRIRSYCRLHKWLPIRARHCNRCLHTGDRCNRR